MTKAARAFVTPDSLPAQRWKRFFSLKVCLCAGIPACVLAVVGLILLNVHWPYRYRVIQPMLEEVLGSQVKIGHYHRIYFPNPGFMATDISLQRKSAPNLPPLGSITSVTVQGRWTDLILLRDEVRQVDITGMHIVVPAVGSPENKEDFPPGSSSGFAGPEALIQQLRIHDSVLDIMRPKGGRFSFPIHMLTIYNLRKGKKLSWAVDMHNPKPGGHILATGTLGPLNAADLAQTPLTGDFKFAEVSLHDLGNIAGTLASAGHFEGTLGRIDAQARSETPDFAVGSGKPTPAAATVHCTVNGINGDVVIDAVDATIVSTGIHVQGGIVGSPKAIDVNIAVPAGRAQDVLRPLLSTDTPVVGKLILHGHAHVDPDGHGEPFLDRLHVDGVFDVPAERLTDRTKEEQLSAFSQRAQGAKSPQPGASPDASSQTQASSGADVLSSLQGPARIEKGIISTERLSFQIPGAAADFHGTFDLHSDTAHLIGTLRMQADISHAATGFKSLLLKPLIPFFKKKNVGASIPIAITGRPGSYKVGADLSGKK